MALPEPIWSGDDIEMAGRVAASLRWNTWNSHATKMAVFRAWKDPTTMAMLRAWNKDSTKMAVLRAIHSCWVRSGQSFVFTLEIGLALAQRFVCFIYPYSLDMEEVHY